VFAPCVLLVKANVQKLNPQLSTSVTHVREHYSTPFCRGEAHMLIPLQLKCRGPPLALPEPVLQKLPKNFTFRVRFLELNSFLLSGDDHVQTTSVPRTTTKVLESGGFITPTRENLTSQKHSLQPTS